ncbi:hypothetical protein [Caenimonas sp. SL110]|uniref:hypothetical protein n=1 Tax=Caenimonas sp. SL110 TaxID=1450524 RepID=UPI00128D784C|nr:hypothetical protein [Caenimonas sp. SL110]
MTTLRIALALGLALTGASSFAQSDSSCLVAGRLSDTGKWAPRMAGVQLLSQDGKAITGSDKQSLANVKQVRVTAPALLAKCDGDAQLAQGPDAPGAKGPVPALSAGTTLAVESVSYPKMRRGGELVELKVNAPAERVTMLTR